jgi:3-dehydroquinate synthase
MIMDGMIPEERFSVTLGSSECPIVATFRAPEALSRFVGSGKTAVLTDTNVSKLHLERYSVAFTSPFNVAVRPGERSKTLNHARRMYEALVERGFDRDDILVAIGGGVVTDLGAFVASTFKRGMGLVLVATTLLGCVDAAVGGKAAVNLGHVKNLIGSFTVPLGVILDLAALRTLNRSHIREGLVEAYKTGLVAAPELADFVEDELPSLMRGDQALLARVAVLSARAKASVVSQDFRESGLRRVLNLGHTVGHAVEGLSRFKASHGAAVAIGIAVAAELSRARGLLARGLADKIVRTVHKISPSKPALPSVDEAWALMTQDKKARSGRLVFVLLEDKGRAVCVDDVSRSELAEALRAVGVDHIG